MMHGTCSCRGHCARVGLLAPRPPPLAAEVVERDRASELTESSPGATPLLVETVPQPHLTLERLGSQVFREAAITRLVHEVAVHIVEVPLGSLPQSRHNRIYATQSRLSHADDAKRLRA